MNVFKSEAAREKACEFYDRLLSLWNVGYEEADISTTYGKTHVIISGKKENPPLVLFHGVGDNSAIMWFLNMKKLTEHFYCIAIDTIGGPGKSVPNADLTKKSFDQADWINQVVDTLGLVNFNIAGVSNGAVMTFNYMVKEPDRVIRAMCLEGGMVLHPFSSMLKTLFLVFPEILKPTRENMIKVMKKLGLTSDLKFIDTYPEVVDYLIFLMKNSNQMAMTIHKLEKYDREKAAKVKDRLYFLFGDQKMEEREELFKLLGNDGFRYKIIKDAGHGVNFDQPSIVENEMVEFMLGQGVQH